MCSNCFSSWVTLLVESMQYVSKSRQRPMLSDLIRSSTVPRNTGLFKVPLTPSPSHCHSDWFHMDRDHVWGGACLGPLKHVSSSAIALGSFSAGCPLGPLRIQEITTGIWGGLRPIGSSLTNVLKESKGRCFLLLFPKQNSLDLHFIRLFRRS